MTVNSTLPLSSATATLRPLHPRDAAAFAQGSRDPEVRTHAHLPREDYDEASVRAMIDDAAGDPTVTLMALTPPDSDAFAGSVVLFDADARAAEVGFWVHPDHRRRGLATAGLALAAEHARARGLLWLRARATAANTASQRVLESGGFVEVTRRPGTAPSGHEATFVHYSRFLGTSPAQPLRTSRLSLRLHRESDAGPLHGFYSRPEVARYLLEGPWSEADARATIARRTKKIGLDAPVGSLALAIEHAGEAIGDVSLWWTNREARTAEIGWVLNPDHGGQGFAAEAAGAVVDLAFETYGVRRLAAQMDSRNAGSAALAERLGMTREAHLRRDWWSKGEWTDTVIFALLEDDARP